MLKKPTKRHLTLKHKVAFALGISCLAVTTWMNAKEIHDRVHDWADPSILAVVAVCIAGAFAFVAAEYATHQRQAVKAILLYTAFSLAAGFELTTTFDRVATQRDNKLQARWEQDMEWKRLSEVEGKMKYAAARECSKIVGKRSRGERCESLENEASIAKNLRVARQIELDPMGRRLASMIPGITAEQASIYVPAILPLALFLLANTLLVFGAAGQKIEEEFDVSAKGKLADELKAERFIKAYINNNGKKPDAKVIAAQCEVNEFLAKRMLKRA